MLKKVEADATGVNMYASPFTVCIHMYVYMWKTKMNGMDAGVDSKTALVQTIIAWSVNLLNSVTYCYG